MRGRKSSLDSRGSRRTEPGPSGLLRWEFCIEFAVVFSEQFLDMAFRLSDLIIAGELFHTSPFSVHGRLLLRGCEDTLMFELTGAPAEDLRGRAFEFKVPENDRPPTEEDCRRAKAFRNQQI